MDQVGEYKNISNFSLLSMEIISPLIWSIYKRFSTKYNAQLRAEIKQIDYVHYNVIFLIDGYENVL